MTMINRIVGPVDKSHGLLKVAEDRRIDKNIRRLCNCCGEWLIKHSEFSHNGPRKDHSFTCKSCSKWILFFSKEWAADEKLRPKGKRRRPGEPKPEVQVAAPEPVVAIPAVPMDIIQTRWQVQWYDPSKPNLKRRAKWQPAP